MNKLYPTKEIYSGWLYGLSCTDGTRHICGNKNILGMCVVYEGRKIFYSILDDCFFEIKSYRSNFSHEMYEQRYLFVELYDRIPKYEPKILGEKLFDQIGKEFVTKDELIELKEKLEGYFSDLDYDDIKRTTDVDYKDFSNIDKNIIKTEYEYEEKLNRPIIYTDGIYEPSNKKRLIKK